MTTPICYRFGPFRLDVATRALWRDDEPLPAAGRAFDCIRVLIEQRHRAVGRDELIQALWGHSDVSDGVLGQTILLARRALDDTGKDQQYIRTVPRFGYHWHAPVEVDASTAEHADSVVTPHALSRENTATATTSTTTVAPRKRARLWWASALAVLLAILATALVQRSRDTESPVAAAREDASRSERLLVRPLHVQGDERMAWFRFGGMALIGDALREHGLPVIASGTAAALAEHLGDRSAIADWLEPVDAHWLVDGQATAQGQRWRLDLHVTDAAGRRQPPIREEGDELLAVTRRASQRLALTLGGTTPPTTAADSADHETALREIESALLTGQTAQAARLLSDADTALLATPRLQLAQAHMHWLNGDHEAASVIWRQLAEQLDPDTDRALLAEAWNGLGVRHFAAGDHAQSIDDLNRAIALMDDRHPTLGQALSNRALAYSARGDDDAARRDFADARAVLEAAGDTLTLVTVDLGSATHALTQDRLSEALPVLDRVADDYAAFGHRLNELNARMHAARTRWLLLDPAGAQTTMTRMAELETQLDASGWRRYSTLVRAQILIDAGLQREAGELLEGLAADSDDDTTLNWQVAAQRAVLAHQTGELEAARQHAEQALTGDAHGTTQRRLMAQTQLLRVRLATDRADADGALATFERWSANHDSPVSAVYLAIARGEHARRWGEPGLTRQHYEQAMQLANAGRIPRDLLAAVSAFVDVLLDSDQLPSAQLVAERVAGWANQHYDAALLQLRIYHGVGRLDAWKALLPRVQALAQQRRIPDSLRVEPDPGRNLPVQSRR